MEHVLYLLPMLRYVVKVPNVLLYLLIRKTIILFSLIWVQSGPVLLYPADVV